MKQYNLVYNPDESDEMMLFSNINIQKLTPPLNIQREDTIQEEDQSYSKKRSEVVEYEDEEYANLREAEQDPWIITDAESRTFSGKFQDTSSGGASMYFVFINMGTHLRMVPISKWYGFVQKNAFVEGDTDAAEKSMPNFEYFDENSDESEYEGADYEPNFDDDDGEEYEVYVEKEKKLTSSGKHLQGLVENYQDESKPKVEEAETAEETNDEENSNKKQKVAKSLTKDDVRRTFGTGLISVKDLLKIIKLEFKLEDFEKNLIREFIHENCTFITDKTTGEKMFRLKD